VPAYEPYPPRPQEPEKRRGIGLWWIPIIVLLAAIGFFAWAYASNNGGGAAAVTTTTVTASASSTSSTSSAPTTITPSRTTTTTTQSTTSSPPQVVINKNDFVGKSFDEAKGILEGAGWKDDQIKQEAKPGKEPAGTVTDIKPTGKVNVGTPITLTVSDGNATAAPKISEGGHAEGD
jgi:serine/threonine-protein kinase